MLKDFSVYVSECVDETPDYDDENQTFVEEFQNFQDFVRICSKESERSRTKGEGFSQKRFPIYLFIF